MGPGKGNKNIPGLFWDIARAIEEDTPLTQAAQKYIGEWEDDEDDEDEFDASDCIEVEGEEVI